MKNNNRTRTLGTCLVIFGLMLTFVLIGLMLAYGSASPEDFTLNDQTRQAAAEKADGTVRQAQLAIQTPLQSIIKYYHDIDNLPAAEPFEALKAALDGGEVIDDAMNGRIQAIRSVNGVENEVPVISNIQRQLNIIVSNQKEAAAQRAAIGTDRGAAQAARRAFLAGISGTVWLVLIICALLITALGFLFNHGYGMRKGLGQVCLYLLLILGAVVMVFPFYWMLTSSLKTRQEVALFPPQFAPDKWLNFENYRLAANTAPFARYFLNSVIVCICSVSVVTFTTILAAFAFSRLKFPGRELVFSALLSMMMLPFEMLIITNYSTVIRLGFNDNLAALVFPFISSIFYTYIMRNFFLSIPESLYWSARVDGCSNWRYLWKVMVPIARPSLVTVVLLNALASWNSFMWPLLVIKSTNNRTLPFGLYAFTTEAGSYQELIMAAATIVVLPMIILFLFCRKQILNGVARGGIKG